jgi:hypothetical protein
MLHALLITARIAAGIIGAIALYIALFLYEDEEGKWQNRIDNLWVAIDKRARHTDRFSVAISNKIGDLIHKTFEHIFGP